MILELLRHLGCDLVESSLGGLLPDLVVELFDRQHEGIVPARTKVLAEHADPAIGGKIVVACPSLVCVAVVLTAQLREVLRCLVALVDRPVGRPSALDLGVRLRPTDARRMAIATAILRLAVGHPVVTGSARNELNLLLVLCVLHRLVGADHFDQLGVATALAVVVDEGTEAVRRCHGLRACAQYHAKADDRKQHKKPLEVGVHNILRCSGWVSSCTRYCDEPSGSRPSG